MTFQDKFAPTPSYTSMNNMTLQVLMVADMKMAVFSVVMLCGLAEVCLHHQGPDDGGREHP
jgi:hypothetical protein